MAQRQFLTSDSSVWAERFGNGSDGALTISSNTTDATANTTASAAINSTALTAGSGTGFAAGNLILIHQSRNGGTGVGNWELNKISSIGGGTNWTLAYPTIYAYDTTAQVYLLKQYSSITVNSGVTLTGAAWGGATGGILALLCNGITTITGTISVNSTGFRGLSNTSNGNVQGTQGEGTGGAGTATTSANGNGAGGADHYTSGSGGGNGTVGGIGVQDTIRSSASPSTGAVGAIAGAANLTTMVLGGAGSAAQIDAVTTSGNGGGIVLIISKTITITGSITTTGGVGTVKGWNGSGETLGAGCGSGGSVLLKGQNLTLGSNLITGTGGVHTAADYPGGDGGTGRIHADYSMTISGTTNPALDSTQDSIFNDSGGSFIFNLL